MSEHAKKMGFHGKTKVCSPPSFLVRSHQGVCDTPLRLAAKTFTNQCHPSPHPQRINGKYVGAYRIRPHGGEHAQKLGLSRKNDGLLATIISCSLTSGRMRYAPTVGGKKQNKTDGKNRKRGCDEHTLFCLDTGLLGQGGQCFF